MAHPTTATVTVTLPPARGMRRLSGLITRYPIVQLVVFALLATWLVATVPAMSTARSITAVLVIAALLAFAAMGQTLVVILGGLDLAIVGYITFGAFVAVNLAGRSGWPLPVALLLTVAVTGLVGAFTGFVCHRFKIQPLVMTLGTGAVMTGGTLFVADGEFTAAPPDTLRALTGIMSTTWGLPVPPILVIVAVLALVLWLVLSRTVLGRKIYATGINPRAAALARINTTAVWTGVFALSGVTAGVAGMLIASFGSGWSSGIGEPYLFTGLAAVLVGGTTFGSTHGSFSRTIIGALTLTLLSTVIVSNGLNEAQSRIVYGVIVLAVVALFGRERHVRDRF